MLVLTVKKISSLDAAEYGRYLAGKDRHVGAEAPSRGRERGDYYLGDHAPDDEQRIGGEDLIEAGLQVGIDRNGRGATTSGDSRGHQPKLAKRTVEWDLRPLVIFAAARDGAMLRKGRKPLRYRRPPGQLPQF